jgi:atypical dual specificity phosphatase
MVPPFSWMVRGVVAGGPHPDRAGGLPALIGELRQEGIGAILSVFETPLAEPDIERYRLRYLWLKTPNFAEPPDLARACRFIDEARAAGTGTLIHCWAGWGRTGTVLAAYLLHRGECQTADEAIERVRSTYDANAVESPEQRRGLLGFAARATR